MPFQSVVLGTAIVVAALVMAIVRALQTSWAAAPRTSSPTRSTPGA